MKKRIMVAVIAIGMTLFGAASPALAAPLHHTTPTYTVTCEADYTYTVHLGVLNSEGDKVMTITSVTGSSLLTVGDTVDKGLTREYTVTSVTAPYAETLDYDVSWPNGVTAHGHAELTLAAFPECVKPTPTPTPTPTVTPTPTPTPTATTPPVGTTNEPELANTGPNARVVGIMVFAGVFAIAAGILVRLFFKDRRPKHRATDTTPPKFLGSYWIKDKKE